MTGTAAYLDTFEAHAHDHADGVTVTMTCCRAEYSGSLAPTTSTAKTLSPDASGRGSIVTVS